MYREPSNIQRRAVYRTSKHSREEWEMRQDGEDLRGADGREGKQCYSETHKNTLLGNSWRLRK